MKCKQVLYLSCLHHLVQVMEKDYSEKKQFVFISFTFYADNVSRATVKLHGGCLSGYLDGCKIIGWWLLGGCKDSILSMIFRTLNVSLSFKSKSVVNLPVPNQVKKS